jgi:hypothetical protein
LLLSLMESREARLTFRIIEARFMSTPMRGTARPAARAPRAATRPPRRRAA